MRFARLLLTAALLAASCASHDVSTTQMVRDELEGTYSTTTSYPVFQNKHERALYEAARAMSNAAYDVAAASYRNVAEATDATAKQKEQALFGLGRVYADILNPSKDYAKAKHYLEKLLADYPDTELRASAESRLESVRALAGE
jgi:TPR repeat protein